MFKSYLHVSNTKVNLNVYSVYAGRDEPLFFAFSSRNDQIIFTGT